MCIRQRHISQHANLTRFPQSLNFYERRMHFPDETGKANFCRSETSGHAGDGNAGRRQLAAQSAFARFAVQHYQAP
jgi:hypothetical protein